MFRECSFSSGCFKDTWEKGRNFQEGLDLSTAQATRVAGAAKKIREQDPECLLQD